MLLAMGFNTIETRTHARFGSLAGRRIAIYAGFGFDDYIKDALFLAEGRSGLVLDDVRGLIPAIPAKDCQGILEWDGIQEEKGEQLALWT